MAKEKEEKVKRYNYIRKRIARGTWQAVFAAVLSFTLLVGCLVLSYLHAGQGPLYLGALGITSIVFALMDLYYAYLAVHERERDARAARASAFLSAFVLLVWTVLVSIGIRMTYMN